MVPSRGRHKGIILQGILTPTGVLPNEQSFLGRQGGVTGSSIHATRQRNSTYIYMVRRYIYNTRRQEHPHFPIRWYERRPQRHVSQPRYTGHLIKIAFLLLTNFPYNSNFVVRGGFKLLIELSITDLNAYFIFVKTLCYKVLIFYFAGHLAEIAYWY